MRQIALTQGKVAFIDDADFELVSRFKWHAFNNHGKGWYAVADEWIKGKRSRVVYMHRLILGLPFKDRRIGDHIDGNGLNNQRSNLRVTDRMGNAQHQTKPHPASKTQIRGVRVRDNGRGSYYYQAHVVHRRYFYSKNFPLTQLGLYQAERWAINKRRELGFLEGAAK